MHVYYAAPTGRVIGSSSDGRTRLEGGIDVRGPGAGGRGGYVLGAGSVVDGRAYEAFEGPELAPLPGWIADRLDPPAEDR